MSNTVHTLQSKYVPYSILIMYFAWIIHFTTKSTCTFSRKFFIYFFFSNSSTGEQPIWQIRNPVNQANSTQNQGKEYSRVEGNNQPDTLFSSSASSGGSENGDEATDR